MHSTVQQTILRKILKREQLDGLLLSTPELIGYYTGFFAFSQKEREGYALITQKKIFLITSPLHFPALQRLPKQIIKVIISGRNDFEKLVSLLCKKNNLFHLGFEADNLTVSEYLRLKKIVPKLRKFDTTRLRITKSPQEVSMIRKACEIGSKALQKILLLLNPRMTERQLALELEIAVMKLGAESSFPPIVAFGKNTATPHHQPAKSKLQENDVVLIDFGVKFNNYCSDMTRTFFFGKPTAEYIKAYQTVIQAQKEAIRFLEEYCNYLRNLHVKYKANQISANKQEAKTPSGIKLKNNQIIYASEVDKIAREYILSQGFPSIPHSLGHGIGLAVHESPSLSPASKDILDNGMVFSIEPGIYLPRKFGIRIEDLFTIQDWELIQLTKSSTKTSIQLI